MARKNVADEGFTPFQVGEVKPPADRKDREKPAPAPAPAPAAGTTTNIRTGNAKVGKQADVITGNITIR
jgi:hypothetical protein